jgi:hypothetical protein
MCPVIFRIGLVSVGRITFFSTFDLAGWINVALIKLYRIGSVASCFGSVLRFGVALVWSMG